MLHVPHTCIHVGGMVGEIRKIVPPCGIIVRKPLRTAVKEGNMIWYSPVSTVHASMHHLGFMYVLGVLFQSQYHYDMRPHFMLRVGCLQGN